MWTFTSSLIMLFFSEGKGLQTVCNETTVGEQIPWLHWLGHLLCPNYEKCTWTYKGSAPVSDLTWWELDVFLTNSGGSSQVSCMHALKCRRSKNAASDSESVTLTTWLWSHNSEHLTLNIWIWSPDSDHLTLITWLLSHDSDQLTLTTWLWSPDCTWGLVGTKLAGCRPDWTSSLCVAPTAI